MDASIPAPIPLPLPGQYDEEPALVWRVRAYTSPVQNSTARKVFRIVKMPLPAVSRLIYRMYESETITELGMHARSLLGWEDPPECAKNFDPYTDAKYLAQSLTPSSLLTFDSRFESGNLYRAYALSETEYQLYLAPDTNSKGHIQWFYFSACPPRPVKATFHIVNFMKAKCLLAKGMRPWYALAGTGLSADWSAIPEPCTYSPNGYGFEQTSGKYIEFYTLSFSFDFRSGKVPVYFAFAVPYTYSDLRGLLQRMETSELQERNVVFKREKIGESTLGLPIDIVTITSAAQKAAIPAGKRNVVVLTARVHPSETPGSLIMHELLTFLISESPQAKSLRERYVFKLVPMLNPDGVVIGNSRTGVEGADLNRRWKGEDCEGFAQLSALKKMIRGWQNEGRLSLFCDLHGHAKQTSAFIYGCNHVTDEGLAAWTRVRLFPRVLSKASQYFNYQHCKFNVQKGKLGTARVVIWQELGVPISYTLETSFYGYTRAAHTTPFSKDDYFAFARDFASALLIYHQAETDLNREIAVSGGWLRPAKSKESEEKALERRLAIDQFDSETTSKTAKSSFQSGESSDSKPKTMRKSASNLSIRRDLLLRTSIKSLKIRGKQQSWREFFNVEELDQRYGARVEEESESSGSDSSPSDDNLEESEIAALRVGKPAKENTQKPTLTLPNSPRASVPRVIEDRKSEVNMGIMQVGNEELEVVSREFVRSREKFPPGKPQDFLFTKIGLLTSPRSARVGNSAVLNLGLLRRGPQEAAVSHRQLPMQFDPARPTKPSPSAAKAKQQGVTRVSSQIITPPILLIESRSNRDQKVQESVEKVLQRTERRKSERRHMHTSRELSFPTLQITRSSKVPTVGSMLQRTSDRFSAPQ